jgi:hypothetical protein
MGATVSVTDLEPCAAA